jgi:phage-related protein
VGRQWESYLAPGGRDKVEDDVKKANLRSNEKVQLQEAMRACAAGELSYPTIKPVVSISGPVFELRMRTEDRSFRLVYAEVDGEELVLLALHFFPKQANSQQAQINEAARRYKIWLREHLSVT